ncbi:MAG: multicopper oxidase family protein [Oscillatoria sp. PMC 1068.18]|nr:multicopper oxidase family protein [Oscillatoria sp. PMC 1076.18]MEC4991052.1 multicopper oxidase family protein [Oscillatoria sp. PMC 1068.18]
MRKLNRRKFLVLSASSAGAVLLSQCGRGQSQESNNSPISRAPVYTSQNNLLELDLEASSRPVQLGTQQANLLTYNGQVPAPRLEAKPGDKVRINFTNNLAESTNLHYHGLHIPPTGNADNVFLQIASGENFTYEFEIPLNHPAGTFWYHPHLHGLVAEQLFGGLAGLFIVRGELDEIPEIKAAKEEFLVLQDFALDEAGKPLASAQMSIMTGREGNILTVSGQTNPRFAIPKNGLVRWRILNASPSRFYQLSLENHPFYLIATDGGALEKPVEMSELLLTPGERVEVLIRGDGEPGEYRLLNLPYDRGGMGMMGGGMMRGMRGSRRSRETPMVLATMSYDGAVEPISLPQNLSTIEVLPESQQVRRFQLNHGMTPGMGMTFLINGQPYQGDVIQTQAKLNTVEDWEISNTGVMDHPFHVHINPFQVISRNGQPEPYRSWKDTVLVRTGETVRIRIPFRDFTGKTVYHCHILDHEDLGMMGNLVIDS